MEPAGIAESRIAAVAALDDRVRRQLYGAVRDARRPMTRDEASRAVGISRKLAAFHLDKLVAVGLLSAGVESAAPRRVGRAPKVYEPVDVAIDVSVPARAYADLASILVEAVSDQQSGETAAEAGCRVASVRGRAAGAAAARTIRGRLGFERAFGLAEKALAAEGYEPYETHPAGGSEGSPDRALKLRNCPFHPLADEAPELVCKINGAFLSGLLSGLGAEALVVHPTPPAGECCAEIRARAAVGKNGAHDRGRG